MHKTKRFLLVLGAFAIIVGAHSSASGQPAATAPSSDADLKVQVEELKRMVQSQQSRIEKLESDLKSANESTSSVPVRLAVVSAKPVAAAGAPQGEGQEVPSKKLDALEGKVKGFGPFSFSGDLRLRHESFLGGGAINAAEPADRHRERIRLRFNATAKLNNEISGGFTLASGDLGDPISTNSTETGFFTRKPIAIDRAWATYQPGFFKKLSITAGKFAYTWYRTEMTFDNDINFEGTSEQVMWDRQNKVLSHFGIIGFQLPLFEVSGGPDSSIVGGQIQTGWRVLPKVRATADVAFYDYLNPNAIAQNQTNGNGSATQGTPTGQGGNFGFSAAALTNSSGLINGSRQFGSGFGILDAVIRVDLDTHIKRFPLSALFNFAENTRACQNRSAFLAAGVSINCNPRDREAYWAEAQFGQTIERGDVRFGYTFARIEREAVVAAFVASDIRQGTNVAQHRIEAAYQAYRSVTLNFTTFLGHQLVTAQSATPERRLTRMQFDVNYKF
jgi:hypothetical protein